MKSQLQEYLDEQVISQSANIYTWWAQNCGRFKDVGRLAKKYLSIPASSVASERIFSSAGIVIGNRRSCLDPNQLERLVFLNQNLRQQ